MTKQEKVEFVISTLKDLYPTIPVPLEHKDPYTLLIAVLMSAQSTDVRVNQITPLLFARADNPYDMIKLSVEEIREIIKPVGLSPMKSKGIHGLSHILIDKHDGKVPKTYEELEASPAARPKTPDTAMSQAFAITALPVASHIHSLIFIRSLTNVMLSLQNTFDTQLSVHQDFIHNIHLPLNAVETLN